MAIGQRFKKLVEELKINANQLAKELDVTRPTITRIINGTNEPSAKILAPLLRKYPAVNIKWLLIGEGEMFIPEDSTPVKNKDLEQLSKIIDALETSNEESKKRGATMDKYIDMLEEKIKEMEDIVKKGKYKK
jgi:transcriptional regulator with XRE-family HTH domain